MPGASCMFGGPESLAPVQAVRIVDRGGPRAHDSIHIVKMKTLSRSVAGIFGCISLGVVVGAGEDAAQGPQAGGASSALREHLVEVRANVPAPLLAPGVQRRAGGDTAVAATETEPAIPVSDERPPAGTMAAANPPGNPTSSAGDRENGATKSSSFVRGALRASFPYDPDARRKVSEASGDDPSAQATLDPAVVILPKVEVSSRVLDRRLPEAIANRRPPGPQNHSRFGTGIHEKDFGKVRASVVTILYVPVLIGISW